MTVPPLLRLAFAVALGIAAGAAAWVRVVPLDPFLDIVPVKVGREGDQDLWDLHVTARGGTIERVRVRTAAGPLRVVGESSVDDLGTGSTHVFRLEVGEPPPGSPVMVRVDMDGRVSRTYDLPVGKPK